MGGPSDQQFVLLGGRGGCVCLFGLAGDSEGASLRCGSLGTKRGEGGCVVFCHPSPGKCKIALGAWSGGMGGCGLSVERTKRKSGGLGRPRRGGLRCVGAAMTQMDKGKQRGQPCRREGSCPFGESVRHTLGGSGVQVRPRQVCRHPLMAGPRNTYGKTRGGGDAEAPVLTNAQRDGARDTSVEFLQFHPVC